MTQTIERTILSNLVFNEDYARRVLPFIKDEYFANREERIVYQEINKFIGKYNKPPVKTSLHIEVDNRKDLTEDQYKSIKTIVETLNALEVDMDWLLGVTEKFCKDKAIYNAIVDGINIIEGKDKQKTP